MDEYVPLSFLRELTDNPGDSRSTLHGQNTNERPESDIPRYRARPLKKGDRVAVKNMKYEGQLGTVTAISTDGNYAMVDINRKGKHKFNSSDLEIDSEHEHAEDIKNKEDREIENLRRLAGYQ
jgi:hypothetical protein